MLTPDYLAGVSDSFVELYAQVERDIISDIARRIVKTNYLTPTAKWQLERANQIGMLQSGVAKILANATGLSEKSIQKLLSNASYVALAADEVVYAAAGFPKLDFEKSDTLKAILLQGTRNTQLVMRNFTNTTALDATKALVNALDRAYLQNMSGAFTREQAIKNAINDLAKQGITKMAYQNDGKRKTYTSIEAGIRRAVSTGVNQTCAELQLARAKELGSKYVETSSHSGARPTHAVWQGQVFSLTGDGKYPDFYKVTEYGSGQGICGWNCYHNFFPYIDGVSKRAFDPDPASKTDKSNKQIYEESQKQRYYERQVRDAKRRLATYKAAEEAAKTEAEKADYKSKQQEAEQLLRQRQATLREYCKETGRDQEYSRTYTVGYNKPYTIGSK